MKTEKKFTIFTIEDNVLYALIIKRKLNRRINFLIINYTNGEDCIKNLHLNPDLIILDFNLLGMNGIETLIKIRKISNHIPVVVLTFEKDPVLLIEFKKLGVECILDKSENPINELIPLINEIYDDKILI